MPRVPSPAPIGALAFIAAASCLASAAVCGAQAPPPPAAPTNYFLSVGLGGGTTIPTGNGSTGVPHGTNIQGYALVQIPGFVCLRFNLGYQKFNLANAVEGQPQYNGSSQQIANAVGGLQINLLRGPVRPYLVAGLGAYKFTTNSDTTSGASSMSSVNFGVNGGVGLAVRIGRVSAFAEGIARNVYTNSGGFVKSAKNIAYVPVTFGLTFGLL
jgi:Outer membrane protein beta-barrel domain